MAARDAKRTLTPEAFGKFLRWLAEDDEEAVREYQSIRMKLIRYFVHKGCTDPYELFDKAIDIVVGKIEACAEVPNPLAYCYGVAKNVWYQDVRERKSVMLDEDFPSPEHPDLEVREQELKCLEDCLNHLAASDRDVVTRYHQGQGRDKIETRRVLADGLGGTNALRIRMCRIRKELRLCVVDCTKRLAN
jgi:DNA-directed RNA polymerase specialized sigma24 family protein